MDINDALTGIFSPRRRTPIILQSEASECGLASLAMIAGHHGLEIDLLTLRQHYTVSTRGMDLGRVVQVASSMGLVARPLRVALEYMGQLKLPCILHWDLNHFVVMVAYEGDSIIVHNPASGRERVSMEEVSQRFTGVAAEFSPSKDFKPQVAKASVDWRNLIGGTEGLKQSLATIFVLALMLEVLSLGLPLAMQWTLDNVVVGNDRELLNLLALGLALIVAVRVAVSTARRWAIVYMSSSIQLQWLSNLFTHLFRLPADFFLKRHSGDIISRFGSADTIRQTLTTQFVEAVLDGVLSAGTLAIMFWYSPTLATISLSAALIFLIIRFVLYRPLRAASEAEINFRALQSTHFLETIRGIQPIKLANSEDDRRTQWLAFLVRAINQGVVRERLTLWSDAGQTIVFGIEHVAILYFGALAILSGEFSIGMFFAFTSYRGQFSSRVGPFIDKLIQFRMLKLHGERLGEIALAEQEVGLDKPIQEGWWDRPEAGSLSLKGLRYRYAEGEPWVLDGLDLEVGAGESVAIGGPSGCGKSTLVKLLLGLLTPQEGEILIGGQSLQTIGIRTYRSGIGAVMQDDQLFSGSLGKNIAFFSTEYDQERVEECARLAGIHGDIVGMPMSYETMVGDIGSSLSGGQKQRVLLARALYRNPKILILDEATSHLDVSREKLVSENIAALSMTRLIVAHRPETINTADRVVKLVHGRIEH